MNTSSYGSSPVSKPAQEEKTSSESTAATTPPEVPKEVGGREGPEPTRFGDWEKSGRCIDF